MRRGPDMAAGAEHVECITWNAEPLCYIVRRELNPRRTTFLTPPTVPLQVGFVVRDAAEEIPRHAHRPVERTITTTSEVLFVQRGRCEIDIYSDDRQHVATRELREGDLVIIVGGGHGFRIIEDTVLLEVKQGPYAAAGDKERF
jgi:hypothetical protein